MFSWSYRCHWIDETLTDFHWMKIKFSENFPVVQPFSWTFGNPYGFLQYKCTLNFFFWITSFQHTHSCPLIEESLSNNVSVSLIWIPKCQFYFCEENSTSRRFSLRRLDKSQIFDRRVIREKGKPLVPLKKIKPVHHKHQQIYIASTILVKIKFT